MTFKIAENCIGCGTCQQACRVGSIPPRRPGSAQTRPSGGQAHPEGREDDRWSG